MDRTVKPTIIIVENSFGYTGAFKAISQVAEDLRTEFNFVFVIPQASSVQKDLDQIGFRYYTVPYYPINKSWRNILLYFPYLIANAVSIFKISKREKARVVHSNDLYNLAPLLSKILARNRIKVIAHIRLLPHSFPTLLFKTWIFLNRLLADKIICVSEAAYDAVRHIRKAQIIYGKVPSKEAYPYMYPEMDDSTISILFLSNYTQGKGQELALEAFAKVVQSIPQAKLTFVGDDFGIKKNQEFKEFLISLSDKLGIKNHVLFKSYIKDVESEFKRNHIFLNLSQAESFSYTCLEALFYGVPCIATASGGPQEILGHGKYGILIKDRHTETIARELIKLIHDRQGRIHLSKSGRVFVRQKFSYENSIGNMKCIYTHLSGQK